MSGSIQEAFRQQIRRLVDRGYSFADIQEELSGSGFYVNPMWILEEYRDYNTNRVEKRKAEESRQIPLPGFEKLLCDKLDRLIILQTRDAKAPFMKIADFKKKYGK